MSAIDDVRTLAQDIVAPNLKALSARLDAPEKAVKLGFEQMEKHFDLSEKTIAQRLDSNDISIRHRFDLNEKLAAARSEAVLARIDSMVALATANHAAVLRALDMERRMERLESTLAAREAPALQTGIR